MPTMKIDARIPSDASLNSRLYVSRSSTSGVRDEVGGVTVTLRKPTTWETLGRRLLNVLSFGAWTRHVSNPGEWKAFKAAVLAGAADAEGQLTAERKAIIETAFQAYSQGQRLTRSKASAILSDLRQGLQAGQALKPLSQEGRVDVSQNLLLRGLRTVQQRSAATAAVFAPIRAELGQLEVALEQASEKAQPAVAEAQTEPEVEIDGLNRQADTDEPAAPIGDLRAPGQPPAGEVDDWEADLGQRPTEIDSLRSRAAVAIGVARTVIRSGYPASTDLGQEALQAAFQGRQDVHLTTAYRLDLQHKDQSCVEFLRQAGEAIKSSDSLQEQLNRPAAISLVTLPLGLKGGSILHEDHSVLVALDLRKRQVIYLDAKGGSPRAAERHYANAAGLQQGLAELGLSVFGPQWSAQTQILMLSNAKQQGANDCFAFTHDFTRRLAQGQTVGDIERDMDTRQRDGIAQGHDAREGIRALMARDIIDHYIKPLLTKMQQETDRMQDAQGAPA